MLTLKNVLLINALSSGATGALLILFANPVAQLFGVEQSAPFWAVGLFLVVFAGIVLSESRQQTPRPKRVQFIIGLDVTWVIGSFLTTASLYSTLSFTGQLLITAVAVWVAAMAFLQNRGLKRLSLVR